MVEVSFCYLSSAMDLFILVVILGCLAAISFFSSPNLLAGCAELFDDLFWGMSFSFHKSR